MSPLNWLTVDDISLLDLLLNEVGAVEIAHDDSHIRILLLDLLGLAISAYKSRDLPVWMRLSNDREEVTSNVASGTGSGWFVSDFFINYQSEGL